MRGNEWGFDYNFGLHEWGFALYLWWKGGFMHG